MDCSFPKSQRLYSRYLIDKLFEPGNSKSLSAYPLRLVYRIYETQDGATYANKADNALLISVPKRCFKHAVDRNRVKRQVREAYRNNKELMHLPEGMTANLALIWLDNTLYPADVVVAKVCKLLQRMSEKINS